MTKDELIQRLVEIPTRTNTFPETDHRDADDALLAYINDERITELYNEIDRGYY